MTVSLELELQTRKDIAAERIIVGIQVDTKIIVQARQERRLLVKDIVDADREYDAVRETIRCREIKPVIGRYLVGSVDSPALHRAGVTDVRIRAGVIDLDLTEIAPCERKL